MKRILSAVAVLSLFIFAGSAPAATYYWDDGTVTVNGVSGGGTGAWTVGAAGWEDGTSAQNWANGNAAVFGGTAGTVTLGGAISASSALFNTAGYIIDTAGYNLTLTGGASGSASTILLSGGSKLTSGNGITINSALTLGTGGGILAGGAGDYGTFSGKITGGTAGTSSLTINGGHTLLNNTANDFLGNIEITSGHYLKTTLSEVIPDSAIIKLTNGSSGFKLQPTSSGTFTETFGGLTGTGYQVWVESSAGLAVTGIFKIGSGDASSQFDGKLTTFNGGTSATLALEKIGTGTFTLAGSNNNYNGGTTVTGGTLQVGTGTGTAGVLPGNALVNVNGTLKFNYGGAGVVYSGQLSGTGAVIVTGANNDLQLSGNNSGFTGTLTVDGSTAQLRMRNDNAISGAALVLANGGAVSTFSYVDSHNITVGSLASSDATTWVRVGASNCGLIVGSNNQSTVFAGVIKNDAGGTGFLTKTGTGTLTLSGANTYSGNTTISAGTLIANNSSALGASGTVTLNDANTGVNNTSLLIKGENTISRNLVVANQGSGTVTIGGTAIKVTSQYASATYSGTLALNRDVTLYNGDSTSDRLIFSNVISGNGNITVDGVSNSRVSFTQSSNNTFVGNVNVTAAGRLQLGAGSGAADMLYDGAILTVASGGKFVMAKGGGNETIGALSGAGSVTSAWGNDTLTVGGNNQSGSFGGVMSQDADKLKLVKIGTGTQTLTGANTANGGIAIQNGTLAIGGASGTVASQALTIGSGADSGVLVLGDSSNAKSLTFSSLNTSGTGTANAIVAGGNAAASTLAINTTTTDTYAGVFGGAGSNQNLINLRKQGVGSLTLSGGGTVAEVQPDAGTLVISGGTLNVTAGFRNSDYGTARTSTVNQTGGTVTLGSGAVYYGSRSNNQAITYNLSGGTFDASAGNFWLAWDGGSTPTFNVSGAGLLKVTGLDQYNTGATGGTLNLTGGQITIGAGGIGYNKNLYNTLNFGGGIIASSAAFSSASGQAIALTGTNGSTTFDTTGGDITLNGALNGTGGLAKSGAGTLTLSGNNSYTGTTSVDQGTLALTGAGDISESATIDVAAGATLDVSGVSGGWALGGTQTLKGNGALTGSMTVAGTLAPGNSIGQLTVNGDVILSGTSDFEINQDSTTADLLVVQGTNGALAYGGILNVSSLGTGLYSLNQTFNLFDFTSQSGSFSSVTLPDLSGQGYSWDQSALYTAGTITVIPEPATVGLIGLVGMMSLLRRRMKIRG